ncbi:MAG TPA: four helix bundle protein [Gemmatimonadaceae bacterium]|nr:four helix bundle protein [Gemmatimonadaceae bacterium]
MSDFRKLDVWKKAHELMLAVHQLTGEMQGSANLSLKSQLIRAAMSIPANIVEGRGQTSDKAFTRYLGYAIASSSELEYHLIAAKDTAIVREKIATSLIQRTIQVRKMLIGLRKKLMPPDAPPHN